MSETEGGLPDRQLGGAEASPPPSLADKRREYQLRDCAYWLGIPPEHLEHPTVRRFVGVVRDTEALRDRVSAPSWQKQLSERAALQERLDCAFHLLTVAQLVLHEGLAGRRLDIAELSEQCSQAAQSYGWQVRPSDWNTPLPAVPVPTGLWRRAPTDPGWPPQPPAGVGATGDERVEPVALSRLQTAAVRHQLPPGWVSTDPVLADLPGVLVSATQLQADTHHLADLPPAPGLTPPAPQRLGRIAPLLRLTAAVVEDELHPGRLSPERFAAMLVPATRTYHLQVRRSGGEPGVLTRVTRAGQELPRPPQEES